MRPTNPDALDIALKLKRERRDGLHVVPDDEFVGGRLGIAPAADEAEEVAPAEHGDEADAGAHVFCALTGAGVGVVYYAYLVSYILMDG